MILKAANHTARGEFQLLADSVEKHPFAGAEYRPLDRARAPFWSGVSRLLRCRKDFGQFAEVLGSGGEEEFVICTAWSSQSQPSQSQNAFEVGEEHLNLLSELHRDLVFFCFGQVSGDLARIFVFLAGYLARISVGTAFMFGWAGLAGQFQRAIPGGALSGRTSVRV